MRLLRTYCFDKHTRWAYSLDFIENCLNNVINDTTGYSANYLQFGKDCPNSIDRFLNYPKNEERGDQVPLDHVWVLAARRLRTKAARRIEKHNAKVNPINFEVGDKVLVKSHRLSSAEDKTIKKLFLLYEGPYKVLSNAGPNCYVIDKGEGLEVSKQNVINLKRYRSA